MRFFAHDSAARTISYSLHIVEQDDARAFNKGRLLNCGFKLLGAQADYFCFHDVDFLPRQADYSWPDSPTMLPRHCGGSFELTNPHAFGGAVLFRKDHMYRVNGYSNNYWGWGCEDTDLRYRCSVAGLAVTQRDGLYCVLPHVRGDVIANGLMSAAAFANRKRLLAIRDRLAEAHRQDGCNSVTFSVANSSPLVLRGKAWDAVLHHRIVFE